MGYARDTKFLKQIALRVKEIRVSNKVTQEDFYNDTGINIGRIERAVIDPSCGTLKRICEYFDFPIKDFYKKGF